MIRPVNPYIAGKALQEKRGFFGRQDTLEWVARELQNPGTNALVLFGQRRIGKTSLLFQLERTLPQDRFLPIYFDLQDQAECPLGQVLNDLGRTIAERAKMEFSDSMSFDDRGHFFQNDFLPQLYKALAEDCRPVFLLDEFDVLSQATEAKLPDSAATKALFPCLRNLMSGETRIAFVFVVGRRSEDLSTGFASIFKNALAQEIWVLDDVSAEALIRQAEDNHTLQFTDEAVAHILSLTHGHPYLTQLLCQRIWERAYLQNPTSAPKIGKAEIETAVADALAVGDQALHWVWDGLSPAERVYAAAIAAVANEGEIISEDRVLRMLAEHSTRPRTREMELAPKELVKRRILEELEEQRYRFAVELFRRWVHKHKSLRDMKSELDRINPLANRLFDVAQEMYDQSDYERAIEYCRDALKADHYHFGAQLLLGESLLELGQHQEAVSEFKNAYEWNPPEARLPLSRALTAQAMVQEREGDENGALIACEQALQVFPKEPVALDLKCKIWTRRGNEAMENEGLDSALAAYRQAGIEGWEGVIGLVEAVLEDNPSLFRTRLRLGEVLLELGRNEEAADQIDEALRTVYRQPGIEQEEQAVSILRHILENSPHNFFIRLRLGGVLLELDSVDDAISELEKAYKINPEETRPPLTRALMTRVQKAWEDSDRLRILEDCMRVMQIDVAHPDASEMAQKVFVELRQRKTAFMPDRLGIQQQSNRIIDDNSMAFRIRREQLAQLLNNAESSVRLLGVVALDPDWQVLAESWATKLNLGSDFNAAILCESDNTLFSKSLTLDVDAAINRRSFRALTFIRDRAVKYFPECLAKVGVLQGGDKIRIEVMHLPIPVSIVQIDGRTFVNLWLHEIEDYFEEVTPQHPWYSLIEKYTSVYFETEIGRTYACAPGDELLELFDHNRIPRGIYPRNSFYDTDYSQWVVWAFIFDRKGRLLLHRRSDNAKDNQGMWDKSVGGHIEFSDLDTSRAVFREVVEELFIAEPEKVKSDFKKWVVSDEEIVFLGEWRPGRRKWYPFEEIRSFDREWAFFRLREYERLPSPRTLPDGTERRLQVIPDVFLFVAGSQLDDEFLRTLENSTFKLVELSELKNAVNRYVGKKPVPGFDESTPTPKFSPDLRYVMTGRFRDVLEEFAQYIREYLS